MNIKIYSLLLILVFGNFLRAEEPLALNPDRTMEYLNARKKLIESDAKVNFSSEIVLNDAEQKLENYMQTFCYHFWNHFLETNLFPPSKNFLEARTSIEKTLLFRIIRRMPKGGVLHIHAGSTGTAMWLINRVISERDSYIYMLDDGPILKGTMSFFRKGPIPPGFQSFSDLVAKDGSFVPQVLDMITMNESDSTSSNPWIKFNNCFERIEPLFYDEHFFRDYYRHAFETLAEDNVQFVELRTSVDNVCDINGRIYSNNGVIDIYRSIISQVREKYPNFMLKIIISDMRSNTFEEERKSLERAFKLRADNPDIVVGYDLIGYETTGHSILYYLDNLLVAASNFEKKYQTNLPYFFHAGETGWGHDKNSYDAFLLSSKRIGHGFNLFHFPGLMQEIKKQKICIEICPISNQVLGYVKDLRTHPAIGFLKQGLPCVLSSDDPMLFKTVGLSYDYWEAIMAWNLCLSDLKQLCLNSILYSSLTEVEKKKVLSNWNEEWQRFVQLTLADLQIQL